MGKRTRGNLAVLQRKLGRNKKRTMKKWALKEATMVGAHFRDCLSDFIFRRKNGAFPGMVCTIQNMNQLGSCYGVYDFMIKKQNGMLVKML